MCVKMCLYVLCLHVCVCVSKLCSCVPVCARKNCTHVWRTEDDPVVFLQSWPPYSHWMWRTGFWLGLAREFPGPACLHTLGAEVTDVHPYVWLCLLHLCLDCEHLGIMSRLCGFSLSNPWTLRHETKLLQHELGRLFPSRTEAENWTPPSFHFLQEIKSSFSRTRDCD